MLQTHTTPSMTSPPTQTDKKMESPTRLLKTIRDLEITGKTVFMRLDFNVPLTDADEQGERHVADDSRIREALPTIRYAIEHGAKMVLASHLGRPKGKKVPELSMVPVAHKLVELLNQEITLADDCIGEGIELMARNLKPGQILLLENLRFHKEETENDSMFAQRLARLADVYVTDAFGACHRKHASTYGLPSLIPGKGIGFLLEKELQFLSRLLDHPQKPFVAILGGSKVSDKIETIEALMQKIDGLLVGGAMAFAFWQAQNRTIPDGAKRPSPEDVEAARNLLLHAKERQIPIHIAEDTTDGFDIGPKAIAQFKEVLSTAKTVFWNGPLGWFERDEYATGSTEIAKTLAGLDALKIAGGGDTLAAVKKAGMSEGFQHLSTGGGAALEFLEGEDLPGIEVLKVYPNENRGGR